MRFEGKFKNEKGEIVYRWFEAASAWKLRKHLDTIGWKIIDLKRGDGKNVELNPIIVFWITLALVMLWAFLNLFNNDGPINVQSIKDTLFGGAVVGVLIAGISYYVAKISLRKKK